MSDDYSGACLANYGPQFVDVLDENGGAGYIVIDKSILGRCWGAKLLSSKGYRVIAVSNIEGTLEDAAKLNIDQLTEMAVACQNGYLPRSLFTTLGILH